MPPSLLLTLFFPAAVQARVPRAAASCAAHWAGASVSPEAAWSGLSAFFDHGPRPPALARRPAAAPATQASRPALALVRRAAPVADLDDSPPPVPAAAPVPPGGRGALRMHVDFFDKDADGIIAWSETVRGLSELGVGWVKARVVALAIHAGLGPKTSGRWTLDIDASRIAKGIHGSDTGVFDSNGDYAESAFRRILEEFDADRSGNLNEREIAAMVDANSLLRPGAWAAARLEWRLLLDVAADAADWAAGEPVRALSAARLRALYDGSLFHEIAAQRRRDS